MLNFVLFPDVLHVLFDLSTSRSVIHAVTVQAIFDFLFAHAIAGRTCNLHRPAHFVTFLFHFLGTQLGTGLPPFFFIPTISYPFQQGPFLDFLVIFSFVPFLHLTFAAFVFSKLFSNFRFFSVEIFTLFFGFKGHNN